MESIARMPSLGGADLPATATAGAATGASSAPSSTAPSLPLHLSGSFEARKPLPAITPVPGTPLLQRSNSRRGLAALFDDEPSAAASAVGATPPGDSPSSSPPPSSAAASGGRSGAEAKGGGAGTVGGAPGLPEDDAPPQLASGGRGLGGRAKSQSWSEAMLEQEVDTAAAGIAITTLPRLLKVPAGARALHEAFSRRGHALTLTLTTLARGLFKARAFAAEAVRPLWTNTH